MSDSSLILEQLAGIDMLTQAGDVNTVSKRLLSSIIKSKVVFITIFLNNDVFINTHLSAVELSDMVYLRANFSAYISV